jgi:hypothetical protein
MIRLCGAGETRMELLEKGRDLSMLLEVAYLDADAIFVAVEKINFLLQDHPEDISNQWVTPSVVVGDKIKIVSILPVCKVSILSFFCIYCA